MEPMGRGYNILADLNVGRKGQARFGRRITGLLFGEVSEAVSQILEVDNWETMHRALGFRGLGFRAKIEDLGLLVGLFDHGYYGW